MLQCNEAGHQAGTSVINGLSMTPSLSSEIASLPMQALQRLLLAALLLACAPFLILQAKAAATLLDNGGFETLRPADDPLPGGVAGWTGYVWEGDGDIRPVSPGAHGRKAMLIHGGGPAKQAIFQEVELAACTYRLTALVAGRGLAPNQWKQSAAVYIALEPGGEIFQDLFSGDSDWRRLRLSFRVEKAGKALIYFFNYGAGGFLVDEVRLEALPGCRAEQPAFELAHKAETALRYRPPLRDEDRLLAGYCADARLAMRPFCTRLAQNASGGSQNRKASAARLIADFGDTMPFRGDGLSRTRIQNGAFAARINPGRYMEATPHNGLPSDWRGHDWLSFSTHNDSGAPQKLSVEINDARSKDYWSRVNHYTMAPPGETRHRVPLRNFVGEKTVVHKRRRLDLSTITRLVFSALEAKSDLLVSDIRLEPEPAYAHRFSRLIALDPGTASSPLFNGFLPLRPDLAYRPDRGYGLSPDSRIGHAKDRRHPDDLLRDWISFTAGGLDFDLPNGSYHVWMMLEDPGYWEYYPNFTRRKVTAEGLTALDQRQDAQKFLRKFYRHADQEDLPGDDVWLRYIRPRYRPLRFKVDVRDGQLNLRFNAFDNPYALALSALVIYPDAERKRGEAFLREMWVKLKRQFDFTYRQIAPPAGAAPPFKPTAALDGRLALFQKSAATDVYANSQPPAPLPEKLTLQLARGETAPLTLSLRPNADLRLADAQLILPGLKATPFLVRNKVTRLTADGTVFHNAPRLLDPLRPSMREPLRLPKNIAKRLWFDIHAPPKTRPGRHRGSLRLRFDGGRSLELPVEVTVRPWLLPPVDIPFGYLGIAPTYPATGWPRIDLKRQAETRQALQLLREHGLNSFTGGLGGPVFRGYDEKGRVQMDFTRFDESMSMLKGAATGPVGSYLGLAIEGIDNYRPDKEAARRHKRSDKQLVRDIVRAIDAHSRKRGWPALRIAIGDEPAGDSIAASIERAKAFRTAGALTSVFTSIGDETKHENRLGFGGLVDLIYLNDHSADAIQNLRAAGSQCALYNRRDRYHRGIYLMKLRRAGCRGHMQFAFNSAHVDHWYDLDGREDDQVAAFTHPDGRLRPALELKRYRMAITDYRYLLKLQQLLESAPPGAAQMAARRWFEALMDRMRVGSRFEPPWQGAAIDRLRLQIAAHIEKLSER